MLRILQLEPPHIDEEGVLGCKLSTALESAGFGELGRRHVAEVSALLQDHGYCGPPRNIKGRIGGRHYVFDILADILTLLREVRGDEQPDQDAVTDLPQATARLLARLAKDEVRLSEEAAVAGALRSLVSFIDPELVRETLQILVDHGTNPQALLKALTGYLKSDAS
jgi:hypothetical protein